MATAEYYDATEIATRILPHLVVLTVDSDRYSSTFVDFPICVDALDLFSLEWPCPLLPCVRWSVTCKLSFGNVFTFMLTYGLCPAESLMPTDSDH